MTTQTTDLSRFAWRTSSYSGSGGTSCIEVATVSPLIAIRDSTHRSGPVLTISSSAWNDFLRCLRANFRDRR